MADTPSTQTPGTQAPNSSPAPQRLTRRQRRQMETRTDSISQGAMRQVDPYSAAVRWLKIGLPVAALCVTVALFLNSRGGSDPAEAIFMRTGEAVKLGAGMRLDNPSFTGATSTGEPFIIRAAWAQPDGPNPKQVEMRTVEGNFTLANGNALTATAGLGVLDMRSKRMALSEGIELSSSDGYTVRAPSGTIDGDEKIVTLADGIDGEGPLGRFVAGYAEIENFTDQESLIGRFSGGVQVEIRRIVEPKAKAQDQPKISAE
ncbi:MAG: hypothetical protein MRY63_01785 [Neomegalonema sp.]|nr:hypothetical protein [Neomegalonema sp.]